MTINEGMQMLRLPNPTTPEDLECRWSKILNFGDKVLLAGYYYNGMNKPNFVGVKALIGFVFYDTDFTIRPSGEEFAFFNDSFHFHLPPSFIVVIYS